LELELDVRIDVEIVRRLKGHRANKLLLDEKRGDEPLLQQIQR